MMVKCGRCDEECDIITLEGYDIEECWGAPVKRPWYEDVSDCCLAETYTEDTDECTNL